MVDSGSSLSVVPVRKEDKKNLDPKFNLRAANGQLIHTFGERLLTVDLGYSTPIQWIFTIAEVKDPVIGIDFLTQHDLVLRPGVRTLSSARDGCSTKLFCKKINGVHHLGSLSVRVDQSNIPAAAREILDRYPELSTPQDYKSAPKHTETHSIQTRGPPISCRPRRLDREKGAQVKEILDRMLTDGIIRPSKSPWGSPIHIVPKKSGSWRLVGDYRLLNQVTKRDSYPLPYLRDFANDLHGKTVYTALDLKDAYHSIPLNKEDIEKTALSTPFGLFEYVYLPFGLCTAANSYQRFVDNIFRNLKTPSGRKVSLFVYLDDILVASTNDREHREDLDAVFQKLSEFGLKLSVNKCQFFAKEMEFLGHVICSAGIKPQFSKIEAIQNFPLPLTIKSLRRYVGMLNYYHSFLPKLASIMTPVTELMSCPKGVKNFKIKWTEQASAAFEHSKHLLSEKTLLSYMHPHGETAIMTDASSTAVGSVLQQRINGIWHPVSFYSRKLTKVEQKYSTFSRELLAIFLAIKKFRPFVEGTKFYVLTDHQPILKAFPKLTARDLPRESRYLEYIALYTTDIRHIDGSSNVVADTLSRYVEDQDVHENNVINSKVTCVCDESVKLLNKQAIAELLYPKVRDYYPRLASRVLEQMLKLANVKLNDMLKDEIYFRKKMFEAFDKVLAAMPESELNLSFPFYNNQLLATDDKSEETQPLIAGMQLVAIENHEMIRQHLSSDTEVADILAGKTKPVLDLIKVDGLYYAKRQGNKLIPYIPVTLRKQLCEDFHALAHTGGKASVKMLCRKYIWPTMSRDIKDWVAECVQCKKAKVTRHNKAPVHSFPEAKGKFSELHLDLVGPLPPNKGFKYLLTIVDRYTRWCDAIPLMDITTETIVDAFLLNWVARCGVPDMIVTDRGAQFESHLWTEVMTRLGIHKKRTTSYHPESNAACERLHRSLKDGLRAHSDDSGQLWLNKLPHMLLAIRSAINQETEVSPAQSVYGIELSLPSDLTLPYVGNPEQDVTGYTKSLIEAMRFVPPRVSRPPDAKFWLDSKLTQATHVLVRNETRRYLQPSYKGPYEVLEKHSKFFKLKMPRGEEFVSIDRLKVCHTADEYLTEVTDTPPRKSVPEQFDTVVVIRKNPIRPPDLPPKRTRVSEVNPRRNPETLAGPSGLRRNSLVARQGRSQNTGTNTGRARPIRDNQTVRPEQQNAVPEPEKKSRYGRIIRKPSKFKDFISSL